MKKIQLLSVCMVLCVGLQVRAQNSPIGLWKTVDDETGKVKSAVRVSEKEGVLTGVIEKILDPEAPQDGVCDKCSDDRKNKPKLGLTIIRHAKLEGQNMEGPWTGGEILDPNNGKTYKLKLTVIEAGKKMEVRGYIGAPILGRTQVWQRME